MRHSSLIKNVVYILLQISEHLHMLQVWLLSLIFQKLMTF